MQHSYSWHWYCHSKQNVTVSFSIAFCSIILHHTHQTHIFYKIKAQLSATSRGSVEQNSKKKKIGVIERIQEGYNDELKQTVTVWLLTMDCCSQLKSQLSKSAGNMATASNCWDVPVHLNWLTKLVPGAKYGIIFLTDLSTQWKYQNLQTEVAKKKSQSEV